MAMMESKWYESLFIIEAAKYSANDTVSTASVHARDMARLASFRHGH
jgi:hypothetical protein